MAICKAAIGYIKYLDGELALSKQWLEAALKIYDGLNHIFGIHFINRWLANIKKKISSQRGQTKIHIEMARNILKKHARKNLVNKHKGGVFVLRWAGDTISIFIEPAFIVDSKPQKSMKSKLLLTRDESTSKISLLN